MTENRIGLSDCHEGSAERGAGNESEAKTVGQGGLDEGHDYSPLKCGLNTIGPTRGTALDVRCRSVLLQCTR